MTSKLTMGYILMVVTLILGWLGAIGNYGSLGFENEIAILLIFAGLPLITACFFFYLIKMKTLLLLKVLNVILLVSAIFIAFSNGVAILIGIASSHS
ncbi:amino acid ABC transporter [Listeria grayi]|uniref:amino acid ABC transporter n=1 Tax=Listeria grayi TaxID=1641 RepID=UPI0016272260|nr:amino acid ABC transporter [Listeria grayi]MBC1921781.1 amino acid ABC transporter [Listeria grayi]